MSNLFMFRVLPFIFTFVFFGFIFFRLRNNFRRRRIEKNLDIYLKNNKNTDNSIDNDIK